MKRLTHVFFGLALLSFSQTNAQEINFAEDIADIIYTHCASCHRPGEIGPFSLTEYEEVRNWAASIKYVTQEKIMPPWQPDPNYSTFLGENYLSQEQIDNIAEWVDNEMPRGDVSLEPPFPSFPEGSVLGTPDLVLEMSEAFLHTGNNEDNYRYFVLPSGLLEDRIVKAIEFRPGNAKIVHHALVFEDLTGEAAAKDAATPEYGFDGFGSFSDEMGNALEQKQFPSYVPGQKPIFYPDGTGQVMHAGADLVVQIHYAPWPVDEYDQSKLNIFFADETETITREVDAHIMVPFQQVINESFVIPPNQTKEFHGIFEVPIDVSILGLFPHMHLLGTHWEVYLEDVDGSIVNLIRVPEWDFNWQGTYYLDRYIVAKAGSKIHAIAGYDNTSNNPNNPSSPPKFVTWGEGTEDEMYYLPINYVLYEEGDEELVFTNVVDEEIATSISDIKLFPNPTKDYANLQFNLAFGEAVWIDLISQHGQKVRSIRKGEFFNVGINEIQINTKSLATGQYYIQLRGEKNKLSIPLIKL